LIVRARLSWSFGPFALCKNMMNHGIGLLTAIIALYCDSAVTLAQRATAENPPCETWRASIVDVAKVRAAHTRPSDSFSAQTILVATWFDSDCPRVRYRVTVDESGRLGSQHHYADSGTIGGNLKLSAARMSKLDLLLIGLPDSTPVQANGSVLLLSYRTCGQWESREYDRTSLPDPIAAIFDHLGVDNPNSRRIHGGAELTRAAERAQWACSVAIGSIVRAR
jgi:hypothetical protein